MDEVLKSYFSSLILTGALLLSLAGQPLQTESMAPDQSLTLADEFDSAQFKESDLQILNKNKLWSCNFFGVRTRLQVQNAKGLYTWSVTSSGVWKNEGNHPVSHSEYQQTRVALVGQKANLTDEVRFTRQGQLISRLSSQANNAGVIAYSVCSPI